MQRIPEPELMQQPDQVEAYAKADFSEPHEHFIQLLSQAFEEFSTPGSKHYRGTVLDLGCGSGDIVRRFIRHFPLASVHGVDGSTTMLQWAQRLSREAGCDQRLTWIHGRILQLHYPLDRYDAVISNSLLHHLSDPQDLWQCIKHRACADAPVFIMDLMRPDTESKAKTLMQRYASDEPAVLQNDFYNSLLAAYRIDEIQQQLRTAKLDYFSVESCSDRHLLIKGRMCQK